MQKLKDAYRFLKSRDGTLFMAGFSASNLFDSLFKLQLAWSIVWLLLTVWWLYDANEQVGE